MMSDLFYDQVKPIELFREKQAPQMRDAEELKDLLISDIYQRYFFSGLENQHWIPLLHEVGFFNTAPDLKEVQEGQFQLPTWYGGQFLTKFADRYPDIVLEVAQRLSTNNARVYSELLKSLILISPDKAKMAVNFVMEWLDCPFSDHFIYEIKDYLAVLLKNGYYKELLLIIGGLLEPTEPIAASSQSDIAFRFIEAKSGFNEFWLNEIVRFYLPFLTKEIPLDTINLLEIKLIRALDMEMEARGADEFSSYWRSAIENHVQNTSLYPLKDLLVDGIRDSLIELCRRDQESVHEIISRYVSDKYSIFRRIAYRSLQHFGGEHPDIVMRIFMDREILDDSEVHHEVFRLLENQFLILSDDVRKKIIAWLFDGPENKDEILNWISKREGVKNAEEELVRYCDYWTIRRMWAIHKYLDGGDKDRFDALVNEYTEPDHPDFLSWSTGVRTIAHVSPFTKEDLTTIQFEKIIQEIKDYTPETPSVEYSREGLAEALNAAVDEDPQHFLGLAPLLMDQDIRFVYTYHYLMAIKTAIERNEDLELKPILDLCAYVASIEQDPHDGDKDTYEAGLRAAQFEVANLLESICKKEPPYLKDEDIDAIKDILDLLLANPDPDPENEIQSGWDPATRSLNCVRGQAMHDLFYLARYLDKQVRQEEGEDEFKPQFDPHIKSKLEEKLDKTNDQSVSVHAVLGWYTPLLDYYDKHWLESNIHQIFPEEPENERYWNAAWDAYVSYNNVYKRPFLMLIPQYHRAISYLGEPEDPGRLGTTKGERLAQHLIYAYIQQLIDLDSRDGLIPSFYVNADDKVRGHVAFWLVKAFGEQKLERVDPIWQRMWELFQWRVETASQSGNVEDYQEEISSYMRWLEHTPAEFTDIEPYVRMAVPFLKEGYHKKLVADYLAGQCERFPRESIEILHQVLLLAEMAWFSLHEENVGKIIEAAVISEDADAKGEAVLVINLLGERGDFQWKKYLPSD